MWSGPWKYLYLKEQHLCWRFLPKTPKLIMIVKILCYLFFGIFPVLGSKFLVYFSVDIFYPYPTISPTLLLKVWQIIVYTEDQKVIFIHNMQTQRVTQGSHLGFWKIFYIIYTYFSQTFQMDFKCWSRLNDLFCVTN